MHAWASWRTNSMGSHEINALKTNMFVHEVIVSSTDEAAVVLMLAHDVAFKTFDDVTDPEEIADEIFGLVTRTLKYKPRNNFIQSIE